jgi:hypothetical protein
MAVRLEKYGHVFLVERIEISHIKTTEELLALNVLSGSQSQCQGFLSCRELALNVLRGSQSQC